MRYIINQAYSIKGAVFFLSENETPCLTKPNPPSLIDRTARCTRGPNNTTQYNLGVPETFQLREISGEGTRLFREHRFQSQSQFCESPIEIKPQIYMYQMHNRY